MKLVKTAIDCFNSRDGIGLFSGPARYNVLEERMMLCAVQARSLTEFWGILCKKMLWPTPPKRMDEEILPLITGHEPSHDRAVLNAMRREPASIVMLARFWHDEDKQARKAEAAEIEAEWQEVLSASEATQEATPEEGANASV